MPETMIAAVLEGVGRLELRELPVPCPGPGEALVRIRSCGFCATDYKAIRGIRRNVRFPLIPGHEPAGVVAAVGRGVAALREGDEVILQPSGYCGLCRWCREGETHYCERAYTTGGDGPDDVRPGSFAEYTVTGVNALHHKPAGISFDAACQAEPVSGAWKGIVQKSEMRVGDDVVVIGTGGIGMYCLMVARAAGAGRLVAVDTSDRARATATRLGATHAIDPSHEDAVEAVRRILPDGPDLVVEAAGPVEAVRLMVRLLRRGTRWNLFGITTHEPFELDGGLMHFLEARMDASFGTTPLAMQRAIRLMDRGLLNPEEAISHRFPLERIHEAVEAMASADRNKVIVNP
ncbi:MAG: alcohol dehydrogenase catalytic domain-containing protein [Chthonomonadales bacterium]|nr:alcohol dehydrogenase catalytic domain-containing protein [Chthonomonadales bacterium]